jgi:hypothetical protein
LVEECKFKEKLSVQQTSISSWSVLLSKFGGIHRMEIANVFGLGVDDDFVELNRATIGQVLLSPVLLVMDKV